jgi:hypothetical protein
VEVLGQPADLRRVRPGVREEDIKVFGHRPYFRTGDALSPAPVLGKELWKDVDPVEHVRAERDTRDS